MLKYIYFNAQGLKNYFLYVKVFCFIQESHSGLNDSNSWKTQWGE
uniref:Uncharacterized protein n=1 Tax=Anguilla anguilla TaxID=7936 RepID=A0A0E9QCI4_ANGAN